jgi:hypothetical protein
MATYYHGIRTQENPTSIPKPVTGSAGLQVIFGTAPINLADDPYAAVNKLILAYEYADAVKNLGYSTDYEKYTLCQSMYASFVLFNVAPVVFCNVLDPAKHFKSNAESTYTVTNKQALINIEGILLDTLVVKSGTTTLIVNMDYIATFNDSGYVVITLITGGAGADATTLKVSSNSIDPTIVTEADIIGGYDAVSGNESGLELVRQVYPKFNLVPGLLLAPGWSHKPNIGAAIDAKSKVINTVYKCENILDIDTMLATKYTDVATVKAESGFTSEHSILCWPKAIINGKQFYFSAIMGALIAYTDAKNDDIPNLSPSNKLTGVTGAVLVDGTEINLDQAQANIVNSKGVVTLLNDAGWRSWGNNTACYPDNTDPKDRWICVRRFFTWWSNTFILSYKEKVDDPCNYQLIETLVDSENIRGNSYASQGKCAGARMEYNIADNPTSNILNGKVQFKQYLAAYTPAEDILNVLEFDPSILEKALTGGEA